MSGKGINKNERYGWKEDQTRGVEIELPVGQINIDLQYQREPSLHRARRIASALSMVALGRIVVTDRLDPGRKPFWPSPGTGAPYWVINGGHRLYGLRLREAATVPCVVVKTVCLAEESALFKGLNTSHRQIAIYYQHNADLLSGVPRAKALAELVAAHGYTIVPAGSGSPGSKTIRCISQIQDCYDMSPSALAAVFPLAIDACEGGLISESILGGFFHLYHHAKQHALLSSVWRERIRQHPHAAYKKAIEGAVMEGSGGARRTGGSTTRFWALGLLRVLNKSVRNKLTLRDQAE